MTATRSRCGAGSLLYGMMEGQRVFAGMHIFGAAAGQAPDFRSSDGPDSSAKPVYRVRV